MLREINGIPVIQVREGKTKIYVPDPKLYTRDNGLLEPAWSPVFYNPRMEFSRDMAVAVLAALKEMNTYFDLCIDPLSGTGIRGLRYANEPGNVRKVIINDINPIAYEFMKNNIELNKLESKVEAYNFDANMLLYLIPMIEGRPDFIDIDPFGSPIPFIDAALHAIRNEGVIAITATDIAPLTGTKEAACRRRYFSRTLKADFDKELGIRILIASIALRAAAKDLCIEPVLSYYADHYYRSYLLIKRGAKKADAMLDEYLGYIIYDKNRLCKYVVKGYPLTEIIKLKNFIEDKYEVLGPLWIGKLCDINIIKGILKVASDLVLNTSYRVVKLTETLIEESEIEEPYYYRIDLVCSKLRCSMPKLTKIIECLRSKGYKASRTHFDPRGIKTNAEYEELVKCIRSS